MNYSKTHGLAFYCSSQLNCGTSPPAIQKPLLLQFRIWCDRSLLQPCRRSRRNQFSAVPIVSANPPSWMVSVNVPAWKLLQMIIKQVVASTCLPIAVTMKDFPGTRERTVDINSSDYHIERYQTLVLKCYRCALSFQWHIFHMDISRADFHPGLWRVYFSHLSWQFRQQFGFFFPS